MTEYLKWDCPTCGKSLVRCSRSEESRSWLDQDGYARVEEKVSEAQYKFLCDGCDEEIHHPDGSTFDEPMDIAEFFKEEDGEE